jgi:poly-gamma-glutamate capsule biosynthesis protein CapA/YwtB (metallophosphatase superfamily)
LRTAPITALTALAVLAAGCGGDDDAPTAAAQASKQRTADRPARKKRERPPQVKFTVSASGDLLMHQPLLAEALDNGGGDEYDFAPFFRKLRPYVAGVDLALCHLETPMGPGPPSTYPIFNTPADLARSIARSGWDACSTASNHSVDQGQAGIDGTIAALNHADVEHAGSHATEKASKRPTILRVRGVKLGFVAYTDATNGLPLPHPWSVNAYDYNRPEEGAERILNDVKRAHRAGADGVIVQLHWGTENASQPNSSQRAVAKILTRSKRVTAVVGQGPHVVQPIERMHHKFVVFSEGNLVSNQSPAAGLPAATQDGLVALLQFVARGDHVHVRKVRYLPTWVHPGDYVVLPASGASYQRTVATVGAGKRFGPINPP